MYTVVWWGSLLKNVSWKTMNTWPKILELYLDRTVTDFFPRFFRFMLNHIIYVKETFFSSSCGYDCSSSWISW